MKAKVTYGLGRVVPIGHYENFRLNCEVTLECQEDELEDAFARAKAFVTDKIDFEEAELLGKFD